MAEFDEQNEVLDFEDDTLPEFPDENPFEEEKPKRTWLYAGIGLVVVTLVAAVVVKLVTSGGDKDAGVVEIPVETTTAAVMPEVTDPDFVKQANDLVAVKKAEAEKPVGMPERVVDARKEVVFDPDKPVVQRPKPRPIAVAQKPKPVESEVVVSAAQPSVSGKWSVQIGSYNTRSSAEAGQRQLQAAHKSLFSGRNFTILAAVLPNGKTTHRLRVVGFANSSDAGKFCKDAQTDNVSCYVTR